MKRSHAEVMTDRRMLSGDVDVAGIGTLDLRAQRCMLPQQQQ